MRMCKVYFAGCFVLCLLSAISAFGGSVYAADVDAGECLKRYGDYLHSFGNISYTTTMGKGVMKSSYNGQYYHAISYSLDKPDNVLEVSYDKCWTSLIRDGDRLDDPLFLITYRDPSNEKRTLHASMAGAELLGIVNFGLPSGSIVILDLLKGMSLTVTNEREDGIDLILLAGEKKEISLGVKAWFDTAHQFALRKLILTRTGSIKPGDVLSLSFSFDKYINVQSISFPTEHHWTLVQINPDNGEEHVSTGSAILSDFSVADNTNPQPFPFVTKIPNGTKVITEDARHIEHIWHDGKVVPKTDEVMLAIAQGGHKFMPGPDEPRFWLMGVGIGLILFACGKKTYDYFKNRKDK